MAGKNVDRVATLNAMSDSDLISLRAAATSALGKAPDAPAVIEEIKKIQARRRQEKAAKAGMQMFVNLIGEVK